MNFKLRRAEIYDIHILYKWRNEPQVLLYAVNSDPVSFQEFEAWLQYNNSIKLIFEVDSVPAGFVAVTRDDETHIGEWSFHLSSEFRNKGLSEAMLRLALYYLRHNSDYIGLSSRIQHDNNISHKLHKRLHFQLQEIDNDFSKYYLIMRYK